MDARDFLFICLLGALLGGVASLFSVHCKADEVWIYDEHGIYDGRVDEYGNQYDSYGEYKGMVDILGNIYNDKGIWQGYVDYDGVYPRPVYIINEQ